MRRDFDLQPDGTDAEPPGPERNRRDPLVPSGCCGSLRDADPKPRRFDAARLSVSGNGTPHGHKSITMPLDLSRRLAESEPLLLDGATGTELERRGAQTELPLWSARALVDLPDRVREIHSDYVEAGAEILTANTFRTQRRTLERGGLGGRAEDLTVLAVQLARRAADTAAPGREVFVVGSAPPLEDCFEPGRVPDDTRLEREHVEHAAHLVRAGVDAILVETMNTTREAIAALRAARRAGVPALVSFVCWEGARLLSGEALETALDEVAAENPVAVGVNCLPPSNVTACLPVLRASGLAFSVYANTGAPDRDVGHPRGEDWPPDEFADCAMGWLDGGARIVGGCCGTTPAHVRAMAQRMRR